MRWGADHPTARGNFAVDMGRPIVITGDFTS